MEHPESEKKPNRFYEYSEVRLLHAIEYRGMTFPKGTEGVIVEVYDEGGYEVEFTTPVEKVIGVSEEDLEPN